jgi:hypothetical protein
MQMGWIIQTKIILLTLKNKKMKTYYLIVFMFLVFYSPSLFSQTNANHLNALKICIELPEISEQLQSEKLYVVMNSAQLEIAEGTEILGKKVYPVTFSQLSEINTSEFLKIGLFQLADNECILHADYVYNFYGNIEDMVSVKLKLQKEDGKWLIINSEVNHF